MRKNSTILFIILVVTFSFTSCEKVIQLDLGSSVPQLVIQGNVYDQLGPYQVTISRTVNFDTPNIYPAVTNATVNISDNEGNSEELSQSAAGTYVTSNLRGIPGRTYNLTVNVYGQSYSASSFMRKGVHIDSVYFKNAFFGGRKLVALNFNNPPGQEYFYRAIHFVNGRQATGFSVFSENTIKADTISYSFMSTTNRKPTVADPDLVKGDVISVWLECIDKGVFEYFRTANSEGGQNASPANPVSNITNGALGYFSACSVSKDSIIYR